MKITSRRCITCVAPVSPDDGSLTALGASVVIGAGVVIAAYAVSLRAFAANTVVAWAAADFVRFCQHIHILASVNNDALAWALVGAILWASIDYADGGRTPAWALGLLVGAALLTKSTAYLMGGVALAAVLMRTGRFSLRLFAFLIPAAVLGLVWWGRNIAVYGFGFPGLRDTKRRHGHPHG